jgi:hypothetical protein
MKETFAELGDEYTARFGAIESLLTHQYSYRVYRDYLHSVIPPCVPYMGIYLTDLTFVLDGNPDKVEVFSFSFSLSHSFLSLSRSLPPSLSPSLLFTHFTILFWIVFFRAI